MRWAGVVALLGTISACRAADLDNLPANTWVQIKYTTEQPADPASKGEYASAGWNKIVYDTEGRRVLFYDRWAGKKQGGYTIYGNCLFAFDPAAGKLRPVRIDNWTKIDTKEGGYRTLALPENDREPTPCPRHVYHAFALVPELKAVFLCNGANQTALNKDGRLVGHDLCAQTWRLDLETNRWAPVRSDQSPPNRCPPLPWSMPSGWPGRWSWYPMPRLSMPWCSCWSEPRCSPNQPPPAAWRRRDG